MGNRLSKIYTRTGDDGTTGLGDGTRVAKDSARVTAYGTVDELNAAIGLAATWDTALMGRVAGAIADEARARGIRQLLAPVINIANAVTRK